MENDMSQNSPSSKKVSKEQRDNLLEAYRILHDSVYRRELNMTALNSILLPASVVLIGIGIEYKGNIDGLFPHWVHVAGFVPLFSVLLLFLSGFAMCSTGRINRVCYEKINDIERTLGIEGHTYVYSKIENKWWWRTRRVVWWILSALFLSVCFIVSYQLFR
jgi:hypothetical protein